MAKLRIRAFAGALCLIITAFLAACSGLPSPEGGTLTSSPPGGTTSELTKPSEPETPLTPKDPPELVEAPTDGPAKLEDLAPEGEPAESPAELKLIERSPSIRGEAFTGPAAPAPAYPGGRPGGARPPAPPLASGLRAGYSDDNAQFNYFLDFLAKYAQVPHRLYDVSERLGVRVLDERGRPVANAAIVVRLAGREIEAGLSYADGTFRFYPKALEAAGGPFSPDAAFELTARYRGAAASAVLRRDGPRMTELRLRLSRALPAPAPLDLLFVLDTTGSMGEEIERLRATIEIIYANAAAFSPRPDVRLGMVLYKDLEDEYRTQVVPFTDDLEAFRRALQGVYASGGGDRPEDLEAALRDAVDGMAWRPEGLRLAFVITDADAQFGYEDGYGYIEAARRARKAGVKFYTVGTGGLPLEGEYVLRQISQLTEAKYIFLTYGEAGESEGGAPGSVSHHTGDNYVTDKLEAIIIRFVREELAHQSERPPELGDPYYSADKIDGETRDQTLDKLFSQALGNLLDYAPYRIDPSATLAAAPLAPMGEGLALQAEYFGERLLGAATSMTPARFKTVERRDLQRLLEELELQLSGLVEPDGAARLGALLGAELLVTGSLYRRDGDYELILRLVRVRTAEILSVTRAKIDPALGL